MLLRDCFQTLQSPADEDGFVLDLYTGGGVYPEAAKQRLRVQGDSCRPEGVPADVVSLLST